MKIGAQDRKKVIIMAVLLVVAVPLTIHSFRSFGNPSLPAAPSEPQATSTDTNTSRPPVQKKRSGIPQVRQQTLDPTLRTDILMASQKIEYSGGTRNIFRAVEPPPPPPPKPIAPVRPNPGPVVYEPPPKPQIPLLFYGFSNRPGEPKKAFLKEGDNIFVAVEGDVVERRYKIVKITNTFILVEDILNNNQQTINLTLPQTSG